MLVASFPNHIICFNKNVFCPPIALEALPDYGDFGDMSSLECLL